MAVVTKTVLKSYFQTGDFPTEQQFINLFDTLYPYEKYVALLTQTGANAPTAVVLENTLGGTIVWARSSAGVYTATLTGAFTANKTFMPFVPTNTLGGFSTWQRTSANVCTLSIGGANDGYLTDAPVEIRVYS